MLFGQELLMFFEMFQLNSGVKYHCANGHRFFKSEDKIFFEFGNHFISCWNELSGVVLRSDLIYVLDE